MFKRSWNRSVHAKLIAARLSLEEARKEWLIDRWIQDEDDRRTLHCAASSKTLTDCMFDCQQGHLRASSL